MVHLPEGPVVPPLESAPGMVEVEPSPPGMAAPQTEPPGMAAPQLGTETAEVPSLAAPSLETPTVHTSPPEEVRMAVATSGAVPAKTACEML